MPTFDSTPSVWSMRGVQVSAFFSACKYVEDDEFYVYSKKVVVKNKKGRRNEKKGNAFESTTS